MLFFFPWATLTVNVAGSFLIGLFYALSARLHLSEETRLFLTTGLCGGFTTFSTFSHENLALLRQGAYGAFALYATLSVATGLAAACFSMQTRRPRQRLPVLRTTQAVTMCSKQFEATMSAACNRLTRGLIPIAAR